MLVDEFLPSYDVNERHHLDIAAPVERVYAAVRELDVSRLRLIRALFLLRGLPTLFSTRNKPKQGLGLTLDALLKSGFILLGETPPHELLLGLVGKFWTSTGCLQRLDADRFRAFDAPGFAKAGWNFSLTPQQNGMTSVLTETRVLCLDDISRRRFRLYWLFIQPFSGWIRMEALAVIKRTVEEQGATQPE